MYHQIIVPLDGTELVEAVLPHVQAIAREFDSVVTLLHVAAEDEAPVAPPPLHTIAGRRSFTQSMTAVAKREKIKLYLRTIAQRLVEQKVRVQVAQVEGTPADAIVKTAQRLGGDLLAIATREKGGLQRFFVSSVADEVLESAPCPVLIVRPAQVELRTCDSSEINLGE